MKKQRLDLMIVERGLSSSRERAKRDIMAGWVSVNGETVREPAKKFLPHVVTKVQRPGGLFVSRGGEKLHRALNFFDIDLKGLVAADFGASTGGFTDCMLKSGARKVYAIDVGYNQLDYGLRIDDRVVVMEKTHVRDIQPEWFGERVEFFSMDLSFISVLKVLGRVGEVLGDIAGVVLLKPQFEARPHEHKKGVVREKNVHVEILSRLTEGIDKMGFSIQGLTHSPIKGPAGNIEFLAHVRGNRESGGTDCDIAGVVDAAHLELN